MASELHVILHGVTPGSVRYLLSAILPAAVLPALPNALIAPIIPRSASRNWRSLPKILWRQASKQLNRVLSQPVICNATGMSVDAGGHPIRIVEWNINHGENGGEIEAALRGPATFRARVQTETQGETRKRLDEELQILSRADVIVLDEVDYGVGRTQYRNIARDLASALGMNTSMASSSWS